ncbi:triose-phosphate isomerase [Desulfofundulus thermosubterraneus]|uniref:Triosephosphate isomerase n=1 Tax=Desulfofundulus thermosubterraneus DSM 16057 TaxID=1121432 RepID=A0A1M6C4Q7_9FIRM|nr:triose-phosphate isomerase [Desulfofundulus thermosubterraneus]SHI55923.1 triosephosphate isomerase [Desulfofundulus thermosubterraneus DSM 16057]
MRIPLLAGNWKMYKTVTEAVEFVRGLKEALAGVQGVEVAVCPPFTALHAVTRELEGSNIVLGAQNMHHAEEGAYTGEISPVMLKEIGCRYVILGHSERRQYFGESDEDVNAKVKAALKHGLVPIVCVGERLEEREAGHTERVVGAQVRRSLAGLSSAELAGLVVAYEPVWAIGTGRTASPEDAQQVNAFIRCLLAEMGGQEAARQVRIQYGGSVKPENAAELLGQPDIDGALVGGASLKVDSFAAIVRAALRE